jgi:hypothetical protein
VNNYGHYNPEKKTALLCKVSGGNLISRSSTANENMNTVAIAAALKLPRINKRVAQVFWRVL